MKYRSYIVCAILVFLFPMFVNAGATTLGDYEAKLQKYKNEVASKKNAINKNQQEIKEIEQEIEDTKQEMLDLKDEIVNLQKEVDEYNNSIKDKVKQSQQLMEYLQLSSGENAYLEYVFNADSTTDLIYRMAIVQQLVDYNNKTINELKGMIDGNNSRETEIDKRKNTLNTLEKTLISKKNSLGEDISELSVGAVSASKEVKNYQELVDAYKKMGCKSSDRIGIDCAVNGDAGIFRRPTKVGYVSGEAGYRWGSIHRGLDIGSPNGKKEKIYPIANGTIVKKYIDDYGALVIAMEHYSAVKNQYYISYYGHMNSFAPGMKVGKYVTSDQYIGYMGETGLAYGIHLHLEVFPCRYSDDNCYYWNNYLAYSKKLFDNGYKGPRSVISFPKGLYNYWYSR